MEISNEIKELWFAVFVLYLAETIDSFETAIKTTNMGFLYLLIDAYSWVKPLEFADLFHRMKAEDVKDIESFNAMFDDPKTQEMFEALGLTDFLKKVK
jgi:hypothetical protein